ncbi:MAG: response regulator [Candidatus Solibacter sp.]
MPRILVADDDAIQLDLRKQLLEIAGYKVDIAFTALQTLHLLEKRSPDLVIVDLRLPNELGEADAREGLALIRRIREVALRVPILVLSGWPDDIYGQPEEQLVARVLLKPVRTRELLNTIEELLR